MLPTRPRALARSMCNSCTTACSSIATRVSCGVTLMRISWLIGRDGKSPESCGYSCCMVADLRQYLGGFKQRQAHDARVAAVEVADESGGAALDGVAAGLVEGLAGGHIAFDVALRERAKAHMRRRDGKDDLRVPAHGDGGKHVVRVARQAQEHGDRPRGVRGLA